MYAIYIKDLYKTSDLNINGLSRKLIIVLNFHNSYIYHSSWRFPWQSLQGPFLLRFRCICSLSTVFAVLLTLKRKQSICCLRKQIILYLLWYSLRSACIGCRKMLLIKSGLSKATFESPGLYGVHKWKRKLILKVILIYTDICK